MTEKISSPESISNWVLTNIMKDTSKILEFIKKGGFGFEGKKIDISKDIQNKIGHEFLFLYFDLADRHIFSIFGPEKKGEIMDSIIKITLNNLNVEMDNLFINIYNERSDEFSGFKELISESDLSKGLFWEFGKRISRIICEKDNVFIIMAVQTVITNSWVNLVEKY